VWCNQVKSDILPMRFTLNGWVPDGVGISEIARKIMQGPGGLSEWYAQEYDPIQWKRINEWRRQNINTDGSVEYARIVNCIFQKTRQWCLAANLNLQLFVAPPDETNFNNGNAGFQADAARLIADTINTGPAADARNNARNAAPRGFAADIVADNAADSGLNQRDVTFGLNPGNVAYRLNPATINTDAVNAAAVVNAVVNQNNGDSANSVAVAIDEATDTETTNRIAASVTAGLPVETQIAFLIANLTRLIVYVVEDTSAEALKTGRGVWVRGGSIGNIYPESVLSTEKNIDINNIVEKNEKNKRNEKGNIIDLNNSFNKALGVTIKNKEDFIKVIYDVLTKLYENENGTFVPMFNKLLTNLKNSLIEKNEAISKKNKEISEKKDYTSIRDLKIDNNSYINPINTNNNDLVEVQGGKRNTRKRNTRKRNTRKRNTRKRNTRKRNTKKRK
jgi:hypothetical protein